MEPAGYSCSQKGTNFRLAARSIGSASGMEINTTSFPRACSLRASVVMGLRCPDNGRLRKPIFIVDPSLHLTVSEWPAWDQLPLTLTRMTVLQLQHELSCLYSGYVGRHRLSCLSNFALT